MFDFKLNEIINKIDLPIDWIGLRGVNEKTTYRVIRDGNPQANMQNNSKRIMVEVLVD